MQDARHRARPALPSGARVASHVEQADLVEFRTTTHGQRLPWDNYAVPRNYRRPANLSAYFTMADGTSALPPAFDWGPRGAPWPHTHQASPLVPTGCTRSFAVGQRGDMRGTVRKMFERAGLCEPEHGGPVHMLWVEPMEYEARFFPPPRGKGRYPKGGIINSVPGIPQLLGVKPALARLQERCFRRFGYDPLRATSSQQGGHCQFTKRAFSVAKGRYEAAADFRAFNLGSMADQQPAGGAGAREGGPRHRIWISKPKGGFNAIGIHMHSLGEADLASDEATRQWLVQRIPAGEFVLQDYVMRPMLFKGHKFDLRLWTVLLSVDPLRLHLLGTGIPKVSMWKYDGSPKHVKNPCVHYLFPGPSDCYYSREDPDGMRDVLAPQKGLYPTSTTNDYWYDNVEPSGRRFWKEVAWANVERTLVEVMLLAREQLLHVDHKIKQAGLRYKRVVFLSPDLVLDERGRAFLVEINTNGYMIGNLHKDFFPMERQQNAVPSFVGATGYPLQPHYKAELAAQTRRFCQSAAPRGGCPPSLELELWEMTHEQLHSSREWYRVWPAAASSRLHAAFSAVPQWASCLTPLDTFAAKWLAEVGWLPEHRVDSSNGVVFVKGQPGHLEGDHRKKAGLGLKHMGIAPNR